MYNAFQNAVRVVEHGSRKDGQQKKMNILRFIIKFMFLPLTSLVLGTKDQN